MISSINTAHLEQKKSSDRAKRGEVTEEFVTRFRDCPDPALIRFLGDPNPQIRTAAAKILGERRNEKAVPSLCLRLSREQALYSKLAISEALGMIARTCSTAVLPELMKYIGKIGRNQHEELPQTIFKKWDYPLPRDIAVRTIVKIGQPALRMLNDTLPKGDERFIREIVDAVGYISFYTPDQSSFENIAALLDKHQGNPVIVWKTIRALQAFPNERAILILAGFLADGEFPQYRWEAVRSLGQIATDKAAECLEMGLSDQHPLVREMAGLALKHLYRKRNGFISFESNH